MPVLDNTITTADVCTALDKEFVENFRGEYDRLGEILGLFPVETMTAGTALYQYKITGQLTSGRDNSKGSSGKQYIEGDNILRSKYEVRKTPVGEIAFEPYAKQTTAQAILKGGFENSVLRTDKKARQQLRAETLTEFFTFLGNGTGSAEASTLQAALALADANLGDALEANGDEGGAILHFVSRQDIAKYLGEKEVTLQTAFGLDYLKSFLGIQNVIVTSKVATGSFFVTPVENIHIYGLDFGTLGSAGLTYETDSLGLIGVHHTAAYDRASAETYLVKGATFLPEIKDYIIKGTIAAGDDGGDQEGTG